MNSLRSPSVRAGALLSGWLLAATVLAQPAGSESTGPTVALASKPVTSFLATPGAPPTSASPPGDATPGSVGATSLPRTPQNAGDAPMGANGQVGPTPDLRVRTTAR